MISSVPPPTNPQNIAFARPGQRQLSAADYNGLVQSARSVESIRRGVSNRADIFGSKETSSEMQRIKVIAEEQIEPWSVFSVQDGPYGWNLSEPIVGSKKYDGTDCAFFTNGSYRMIAGTAFYAELCDMYRPHILRYTGTPPSIGSRLGIVNNSYDVSTTPLLKQFTTVSTPNTTDSLVWAVRAVCPQSDDPLAVAIDVFEFIEVLKPGYTARARICAWDSTATPPHYIIDPTDTKEYLLFDPEEQNFFLEEERCHALKRVLLDSQASVFCDYVILGAHGLRRKVRVQGDIDCGAMGQAQVQRSEPATIVHPPPDQQDATHCILAASTATLDVCNYNGYNRKVLFDELMDMDWDHNRQVWHLNQEDRPIVYEGILTNKMCGLQDSSGNAVTEVKIKDWVREPDVCSPEPEPPIATVDNPLGLWADADDKVFFTREEFLDSYHIFQVLHKETKVIVDIAEASGGDCPGKDAVKRTFGMQFCDETPEFVNLYSAAPVTLLSNVQTGSCGISFTQTEVCVLQVLGSSGGPGITGEEIDVITDFQLDGDETDICKLVGVTEKVCVLNKLGAGTPVEFNLAPIPVATGIVEGPDPNNPGSNCVLLKMENIAGFNCNFTDTVEDKVIFCVVDCEEVPTTVLPEAGGDESYNVGNRQTRPYDSSTATPGGIIIVFPDSTTSADGDIVHITNNGMSDIPVTLDGNGNNVQAITAPYNAATVLVNGPRLSINYQLRDGVWRII